MAEPEVVYFNDPDKGRKRTRISDKDKKRLRQGDVAELFALSGPVTSPNTATNSDHTKTWSKSDLSSTIREISTLADTLTQQMETEKKQKTKSQLKGQQKRNSVKSYPQIQKEKKEKELKKKEEQWMSGTTFGITDKKSDKRRRAAKGKGRWKDNIKALDPPVGRFKNGVLSLSQKEVKKISKSSL